MSKNTFKVIDKKLTIDQRGTFINRVVESCFSDLDLHIEMLEPMFAITVLQMMTDKEPITTKATIDGKEVDVIDYNATYEMIENEHIVRTVKSAFNYIDMGYLDQLHSDVVESLEFKKEQAIAMTSPLSALLTSIKNAVDNMDMSKAKDILEMASKMNKAGLNDSGTIIDTIVKNAQQKDVK